MMNPIDAIRPDVEVEDFETVGRECFARVQVSPAVGDPYTLSMVIDPDKKIVDVSPTYRELTEPQKEHINGWALEIAVWLLDTHGIMY